MLCDSSDSSLTTDMTDLLNNRFLSIDTIFENRIQLPYSPGFW